MLSYCNANNYLIIEGYLCTGTTDLELNDQLMEVAALSIYPYYFNSNSIKKSE